MHNQGIAKRRWFLQTAPMKTPTLASSRRKFLTSTSSIAAGSAFGILGCRKTMAAPDRKPGITVGEGDHRYEVIHNWATLPDKYSWQTTHNVAVDKDENLYVIHEGKAN